MIPARASTVESQSATSNLDEFFRDIARAHAGNTRPPPESRKLRK
jgi:hypothetical protein